MRALPPTAIPGILAAALLLLVWTSRPAQPAPELEPGQTASSLPATTPPSPAAAAPQAGSAPGPHGSDDRIARVRRCLAIADRDPLAAMDLAIAEQLTADDPGLLTTLILRWAGEDFSGALEWTRAQPRDPTRDDLLAHLAFLRSQDDPAVAAEIAAIEIVGPRAREEAILSVVHQWAHRSPEAAWAWSGRLDAPDLRHRAMGEISAVRAAHDAEHSE